jgi:hypothetical protein
MVDIHGFYLGDLQIPITITKQGYEVHMYFPRIEGIEIDSTNAVLSSSKFSPHVNITPTHGGSSCVLINRNTIGVAVFEKDTVNITISPSSSWSTQTPNVIHPFTLSYIVNNDIDLGNRLVWNAIENEFIVNFDKVQTRVVAGEVMNIELVLKTPLARDYSHEFNHNTTFVGAISSTHWSTTDNQVYRAELVTSTYSTQSIVIIDKSAVIDINGTEHTVYEKLSIPLSK